MAARPGEIVWVSGPLPGAVHDLTPARIGGIIAELAASGPVVLGDKGYAGGGEHIRIPYKGQEQAHLPAGRQPGSCPAARSRRTRQCPAQVLAILRRLRCCPWKAGQLAKAIHVLQARQIGG
jgi:hypothetical protein